VNINFEECSLYDREKDVKEGAGRAKGNSGREKYYFSALKLIKLLILKRNKRCVVPFSSQFYHRRGVIKTGLESFPTLVSAWAAWGGVGAPTPLMLLILLRY